MAEDQANESDQQASRAAFTRIDGPHAVESQQQAVRNADANASVVSASAGVANHVAVEQLRCQTSQLASLLRERQQQLDLREAELDTRAAELAAGERHTSQATLPPVEPREDALAAETASLDGISLGVLDSIRQRLEERETQITQTERQLAESTQSLQQQQQRWNEEVAQHEVRSRLERQKVQQARLAVRQQERVLLANLARHRQVLQDREEQLQKDRRKLSEITDLRQRATALEAREQQLAEADQSLHDQHQRMLEQIAAADRRQLARQKTIQEAQLRLTIDQDQFAAQQRELTHRFETHRDQVAQRERISRQLRDQTTHLYQEALEMRLLAEQTWLEIGQAAQPADVARKVGEVRGRMESHFRFVKQELDQKLVAIQQAAQRLDEQTRKLRRRKEEFQHWREQRLSELEEQAAKLATREKQLHQDTASVHALEQP